MISEIYLSENTNHLPHAFSTVRKLQFLPVDPKIILRLIKNQSTTNNQPVGHKNTYDY